MNLSFLEFFKSARPGTVFVTTHVNADPDAVASALLLREVLKSMGFTTRVCFPEGPSKLSKKLIERFGISYNQNCSCSDAEYVVVCDTSNEIMLSEVKECLEGRHVVVVDHHEHKGSIAERAALALVEREASAVTLAVEIAQIRGLRLGRELSTLALAGIVFDTKRFALATPRTLRAAAWLLEQGGSLEEALISLEEEPEYAERIARLKAAQRAMILDVCGYLVAVSEVSSFEASAARALVSLGADLAIVVGGKEGEVRASSRLSRDLAKLGVDLSDIARSVASVLGGEGGGHTGAAGVKVIGKAHRSALVRELLQETLTRILARCARADV
uniref:DHH family phosphoesterase n=1 Tax=Thermofilum pendens TaxID=2269 RepID=A0A7C1P0S1_THEPE